MTPFRPCVLIPTYDNPATIERVARAVFAHWPQVVVVDDGSGQEASARIDALVRDGVVKLHRRADNGGKGAAVKDGLRFAQSLGYTHALQVDADGQHALEDIPRFLDIAREDPTRLVLGQPRFDASIPAARLYGRQISVFWATIETLGDRVGDPLCGFRVYPIEAALAANARGDRMDFDPEIIVRMVWAGVPVVKLETAVRYVAASDGGVSHFQGVRDNVRISLAHTRLVIELIVRCVLALFGARTLRLAPRDSKHSAWLRAGELGSVLGIRIVLAAATLLGRAPMRGLLAIIVLYYALMKRTPRQASREYLTRIGQPAGFWDVYRHLLRFAQCAADRIFLITGKTSLFEIHTHGSEHLTALRRENRGAILLSAHLGSFEALHAQAGRDDVTINVVGYFRNAERINRVLERLGSTVHARLLEPRPGIDFALKLRDCLERGELVGVLGDRNVDGKTVEVDFLGSPARFPTGAFALAAAMRCPVLLTFALHTPPNRYDLYCEPFVEQVVLPRKEREAALRAHVQRYAARLEHYCRMRPDNWFNFYDFWSKSG